MSFDVIRQNLDLLEKKSSFTPEDVLYFMSDFCKETDRCAGCSVSHVKTNDTGKLINKLLWAMQYTIDIARTNITQDLSQSRREHLEKMINRLEKISEEAEAEKEIFDEIKKSEQELARRKAEMLEVKKEEERLRTSCEGLRQDINQLSTVDKEKLKEEETRLLERKVKIKEELDNKRLENEKISRDLKALGSSLAQAQAELKKLREELQSANNDTSKVQSDIKEKKRIADEAEAYNRRLEEDIAKIDEEILKRAKEKEDLLKCKADKEKNVSAVNQEIKDINAEIDDMVSNCRILEKKIKDKKIQLDKEAEQADILKKEVEELDSRIISSNKEINDLIESIKHTKDMREELLGTKKNLNNRVMALDAECACLRNEIRILERNLRDKDFTDQVRILEEEKREKEKLLITYEKTKKEIEKISEEIKKVQDDQTDAEKKLQKEKEKLQRLQNENVGRLNDMNTQIINLKQTVAEYIGQIKELETWMSGIEGQELKDQAGKLHERLTGLRDVRDKLEKVWQSSWYQSRNFKSTQKNDLIWKKMRDDLENMDKLLKIYRKTLIEIIDSLGSKNLD